MRLVWREGLKTVADVTEKVNADRDQPLDYRTILTVMSRLTKKRLLRHRRHGNTYHFGVTCSEDEFAARQGAAVVAEVVNRLHGPGPPFGGCHSRPVTFNAHIILTGTDTTGCARPRPGPSAMTAQKHENDRTPHRGPSFTGLVRPHSAPSLGRQSVGPDFMTAVGPIRLDIPTAHATANPALGTQLSSLQRLLNQRLNDHQGSRVKHGHLRQQLSIPLFEATVPTSKVPAGVNLDLDYLC